jgi:hypothetical protein
MKSTKWRRFEELVTRIQRELAPHAVVTHNDKIQGKITGARRQVDVSIKQHIGNYEILIAIDCKDLARSVDVKDVEEVVGLFTDIRANKGAIVSASGFTPAAKARGESAGIDLFRLVDTGPHEWRAFAQIPVVCDFRAVSKYRLKFRWTGPAALKEVPGPEVLVYGKDGGPLGLIGTLMKQRWNEGALPSEPGHHTNVDVFGQVTFMKSSETLLGVTISADIVVEQKLYFGHVPLAQISGFKNEIDGRVVFSSLTTQWLDLREVEQTWRRIESIDELAVKPVLLFVATDSYETAQPANRSE